MSWTQLVAAWGMEIGLSAPVAGTLGVVGPIAVAVIACCAVLGGLEAWSAHMRRAAGGSRAGSEDQKQPAQRKKMGRV